MCFPVIQKTCNTRNPWDLMVPEHCDKKFTVREEYRGLYAITRKKVYITAT